MLKNEHSQTKTSIQMHICIIARAFNPADSNRYADGIHEGRDVSSVLSDFKIVRIAVTKRLRVTDPWLKPRV